MSFLMGPAEIACWADSHGHVMTTTRFYLGEQLPAQHSYDWLVVLGGPMGVADEAWHPWLVPERHFIKAAINAGKTVLGICLGAQLIARALGAAVRKNPCPEIGWFEIRRSEEAALSILDPVLPATIEAFHWHGDTFDLPNGALPLASSAACQNQGFILDDRIIGFQFHLETNDGAAGRLLEHCGAELVDSPYVQTADEISSNPARFDKINQVLRAILSQLAQRVPAK